MKEQSDVLCLTKRSIFQIKNVLTKTLKRNSSQAHGTEAVAYQHRNRRRTVNEKATRTFEERGELEEVLNDPNL